MSTIKNTNWEWLDHALPKVTQDTPWYLPKRLLAVWQLRNDLQNAFPVDNQNGRIDLLLWWLQFGTKEYDFLQLSREELQWLSKPDSNVLQDTPVPITRGLIILWNHRADLQRQFPLQTPHGRSGLIQWWSEHSAQVSHFIPFPNDIEPQENTTAFLPFTEKDSLVPTQIVKFGDYDTGGVNVTGFATGVLGLGEEARMVSTSMITAKIPISVYDVPLKIAAREPVPYLDNYLVKKPKYNVNLICLPGSVTYQLLLEIGTGYFNGRFNIGAWFWELPHWPDIYKPYYNLVNEIWASSHYMEKMFLETSSVPVKYMPSAVELPTFQPLKRADHGLPENKFLFLVMFDGNSWLARKNPLGSVRAFLEAFPKHDKSVGLVIKAMGVNENSSEWQEVCKHASKDNRIIVLNKIFTRGQTISLINCCDAYISLHRSEGFGRILAESMLLGKPVITTNHSGNTDFTRHDTAFLVDGPIIELKQNDYVVWEGQSWCDPDILQAAEQMRYCVQDPALRHKISASGQQYIRTHYSASVVGANYHERLIQHGLLV